MTRMLRHLPNMLTTLRLAAAPATAGLLTTGHFEAALGIFAIAGVSDAADGFLAKRFGFTSRVGRFLDPAADKVLMLVVFLTLSVLGVVPFWLTFVIFAREALMLSGIALAVIGHAPLVVKPLLIGKLATGLQIVYIVAHLAALAFNFSLEMIEPGDAYLLATVTIFSLFAYGRMWFYAMRAVPRSAEPRSAEPRSGDTGH